jgi:hypothetical protein
MIFSKLLQFGACLIALSASGCTSYYRITDQASRAAYFTTEYERANSGAVQFQDEKSRATVTLQSSEIKQITRDEFDSGIKQ